MMLGLVFLGQHNRQNPVGHGCTGWVRAQVATELVEIVPLPENLAPLMVERSKIMFAVRVVVRGETVKASNLVEDLELVVTG